jgi:spore coat protein U-like protein
MKKILFMMLAMLLAMAGTSMAATVSNTVPVTATILGSCTINTAAASIDFGSLDPVLAPAVVATVAQPDITCTNLMAYTITDDDGLYETGVDQNRMWDAAVNFIPYTINYTSARVGTGAIDPMDITGNIAAGAYTGFPNGNYNDTITFTVTW